MANEPEYKKSKKCGQVYFQASSYTEPKQH